MHLTFVSWIIAFITLLGRKAFRSCVFTVMQTCLLFHDRKSPKLQIIRCPRSLIRCSCMVPGGFHCEMHIARSIIMIKSTAWRVHARAGGWNTYACTTARTHSLYIIYIYIYIYISHISYIYIIIYLTYTHMYIAEFPYCRYLIYIILCLCTYR
jgi:hypothetical protein